MKCRSIEHARHVHAIIWATKGGDAEVRFYQCPDGGHHWTRDLDPTYHQQKAAA